MKDNRGVRVSQLKALKENPQSNCSKPEQRHCICRYLLIDFVIDNSHSVWATDIRSIVSKEISLAKFAGWIP